MLNELKIITLCYLRLTYIRTIYTLRTTKIGCKVPNCVNFNVYFNYPYADNNVWSSTYLYPKSAKKALNLNTSSGSSSAIVLVFIVSGFWNAAGLVGIVGRDIYRFFVRLVLFYLWSAPFLTLWYNALISNYLIRLVASSLHMVRFSFNCFPLFYDDLHD